MSEYLVVSKSVPRVDALEKVTGAAKYGVDIQLPGMLHGKIVRSKHAHAKVLSIDTSEAEKLDGVRAMVTQADITGKPVKPTLATMANAVADAVGVRIKELPMKPERIVDALKR